jgi:predicted lipoprotein with Yx(FWY)xxD motif
MARAMPGIRLRRLGASSPGRIPGRAARGVSHPVFGGDFDLAHRSAESRAAHTVQLRHTSLGSILVNSSGRTLYEFTRDHTNKNSCAAISGCSAVWPSLKASGRPAAGSGIKASLLSSHDGQVTYTGHPLYTYSRDNGPGKTSYVGVKEFGGTWPGSCVRAAAAPARNAMMSGAFGNCTIGKSLGHPSRVRRLNPRHSPRAVKRRCGCWRATFSGGGSV